MKELKKKLIILENKEFFPKKFKKEEQKNILYNIAIIMEQGYSLMECIKLLAVRLNIENYLIGLEEGEKFSQILAHNHFDKDVLLIIEISESSDDLKNGINKAILIIENKIKNKNQVWEELKYPLLLGIVMLAGMEFIGKFLIPTFLKVYKSFGIEVGIFFQIFFQIIVFLPKLIFITIVCIFLGFIYIRGQEAKERLNILTKYRLFKKQYYKIYNQIFLINLTALLELQLRIDEVFIILKKQKYNYLLSKESTIILEKLYEGEDLSEILKNRKIYNKDIIRVIKDGEEYGALVKNLKNYLLIKELDQKKQTEKYLFLIQPLFYGIFGIMIILLYASIFIPMFKIMDSI